jgi:hypothetical protein
MAKVRQCTSFETDASRILSHQNLLHFDQLFTFLFIIEDSVSEAGDGGDLR